MILLMIEPPKIWTWKAHGGFGRHSFNPMQKERDFVQYHLKKQYHDSLLASPLRVSYDFYFTIPKSTPKKNIQRMLNQEIYHTKVPDCSNVTKFFEDTLKGVVIEDDKYVVETTSRKLYGTKCKVIIRIDVLA